jgi:hypothetical protein
MRSGRLCGERQRRSDRDELFAVSVCVHKIAAPGFSRKAPELRKNGIEEKEIGQWTIYIPASFTAQSLERIISHVSEKVLPFQARFCSGAFPVIDLLAALPLANANPDLGGLIQATLRNI